MTTGQEVVYQPGTKTNRKDNQKLSKK